MSDKWSSELQAALAAVAAATRVILDYYAHAAAANSAPADISTQADRDSQETILQSLGRFFPSDAFRAEEATPTLQNLKPDGDRMWIIDPIDGTRGFVTKNGEFSIMVALCEAGVPVVGVVAEPARNVVTWATQNNGCWQKAAGREQRKISVTDHCELTKATLIQSHSKPGTAQSLVLQRLQPARIVETYSAGIKLARIADGSADIYYCDYAVMKDWDLAAGQILVTEAGGLVTNLIGEPRVYGRADNEQCGGILATNGKMHAPVIAKINGA